MIRHILQKSNLPEATGLDISTFAKAVVLSNIKNQADEFGELKKLTSY